MAAAFAVVVLGGSVARDAPSLEIGVAADVSWREALSGTSCATLFESRTRTCDRVSADLVAAPVLLPENGTDCVVVDGARPQPLKPADSIVINGGLVLVR